MNVLKIAFFSVAVLVAAEVTNACDGGGVVVGAAPSCGYAVQAQAVYAAPPVLLAAPTYNVGYSYSQVSALAAPAYSIAAYQPRVLAVNAGYGVGVGASVEVGRLGVAGRRAARIEQRQINRGVLPARAVGVSAGVGRQRVVVY